MSGSNSPCTMAKKSSLRCSRRLMGAYAWRLGRALRDWRGLTRDESGSSPGLAAEVLIVTLGLVVLVWLLGHLLTKQDDA